MGRAQHPNRAGQQVAADTIRGSVATMESKAAGCDNRSRRPKDIAVPQVPLDPLQILEHARAQLVLVFPFAESLRQSLAVLL